VLWFEGATAVGQVADEGENAGPVSLVAEDGGLRVEVGLSGPMAVEEAGLVVSNDGGRLVVRLAATDAEGFAAVAAPGATDETDPPAARDDGRFVVALDPGHGGVDPGAERGAAREADLMLALGLELEAALEAAGVEAVLTREEDRFVALSERVTRARAAGRGCAAVAPRRRARGRRGGGRVGLRAGGGGGRRGLAPDGGPAWGRGPDRRARPHGAGDGRGDGADGGGAGRDGAGVAPPRRGAGGGDGRGRRRGERPAAARGEFAVLAAADFPGVLLETGFLSDDSDRARLSSPAGRAPLAAAVAGALVAWAEAEGLR
jgi:N-acetylmuramoyl-L-alanine amidase